MEMDRFSASSAFGIQIGGERAPLSPGGEKNKPGGSRINALKGKASIRKMIIHKKKYI